MIRSFRDDETERVFSGIRSRKLPADIQNAARRKLRMIDHAHSIDDLRVPPGNRLESLGGVLQEFWSIRVNVQWRIIFRWIEGEAHDVGIIDYH